MNHSDGMFPPLVSATSIESPMEKEHDNASTPTTSALSSDTSKPVTVEALEPPPIATKTEAMAESMKLEGTESHNGEEQVVTPVTDLVKEEHVPVRAYINIFIMYLMPISL
jgi:hypothetical protein